MKAKVLLLLVAVLSLASANSVFAKERFEIKHTTAGAIEKHLKLSDSDTKVALIAEVLSEDTALNDFSDFLVDICLNPKKYDFEGGDEDKSQCDSAKVHQTIVTEIAEGLVFFNEDKKDAIQVERHLNDFMNNYLEKVRAVIDAFNNWM